ncbi:TetR/AcrR family transcriptional regulator [Acetobacter sacchari]|uniref:TetR/AcrR family transcriptional regulator n=1 Tax=Acetobacter sacchari TaxID=2661687 RepID=UPI00311CC182
MNLKANPNAREAILAVAKRTAQIHGYGGLNFRDIANDVGIKAASIYYHFPSKADLGAAVARRYWEDTLADLKKLQEANPSPQQCLLRYPEIFRRSLQNGNRLCLCSFMSAEYDDLPDVVKQEVQTFVDVNIRWLSAVVQTSANLSPEDRTLRAQAVFSAVSGAQLLAKSRSDISVFDEIIGNYHKLGLLS